jgi:hypothetical protein
VKYQQLLDEDEYYELRVKAREEGDSTFKAEIGAEAIRTLLKQLGRRTARSRSGTVTAAASTGWPTSCAPRWQPRRASTARR